LILGQKLRLWPFCRSGAVSDIPAVSTLQFTIVANKLMCHCTYASACHDQKSRCVYLMCILDGLTHNKMYEGVPFLLGRACEQGWLAFCCLL